MIVSIAGNPGSGKSTVAKLIVEFLKAKKEIYELIDVGALRRDVAKNKGMTIEEFNEWSKNNLDEGDKEFDNFVAKTIQLKKNAVVVGRMAFHFLPQSLKIFIDVDFDEGAKRIFNQKKTKNKRNEAEVISVEQQKKINEKRVNNDIERYMKAYSINPYDTTNFDLIIDSTFKSPEEIVEIILARMGQLNV